MMNRVGRLPFRAYAAQRIRFARRERETASNLLIVSCFSLFLEWLTTLPS